VSLRQFSGVIANIRQYALELVVAGLRLDCNIELPCNAVNCFRPRATRETVTRK
jgi:hypothetical protein